MKLTIITTNTREDYDSWKDAQTEYISFVPPHAKTEYNQAYFNDLMGVFLDQPLFRKLSMVGPSLRIDDESPVFSWVISPSSVIPSRIKSSIEPYAAQVAYLPGAIIKKTALERIQPDFTAADIHDSINVSISLWNAGLRCFINPKVMVHGDKRHSLPIKYQPDVAEKVKQIWKREMVG